MIFFSEFIFHNLNNSIFDAAFPSELKNTDVIPVFKKKDRNNVENSRQVSILTNLSKIHESVSTINCIYISIIYSQNGNVDSVKALAHNTVFL